MSTPRRPAPRSIGTPITCTRFLLPVDVLIALLFGKRGRAPASPSPLIDHHLHTKDRPAALDELAGVDLDDVEACLPEAPGRLTRAALHDDRPGVERVRVARQRL